MDKQVLDILMELARAVQRYGMYPEGHPSRRTTASSLGDLLRSRIAAEGALPLRMRRSSLRVGGEESDPGNALLAALAHRLTEHQLHVVTFAPGLKDEEVQGFLAEVARPVGKVGDPFGAAPPEVLRSWPNIRIEAVPYAEIAFADGTESGTYEDGAPSATAGGTGGRPEAGGAGSGGLGASRWGIADSLAARINQTVLKLSGENRRRLHGMLKEVLESEGVGGSANKAIEHLVRSASSGGESTGAATMLRVIASFSSEASTGVSPDAVLGELVDQLSAEQGEGPGIALPEGGTATGTPRTRVAWVGDPEPERILQIAVEIEEAAPMAHTYLNGLLEEEQGIRRALDILDPAPAGNTASDAMMDWVARPRTVRRLLESDPPDLETLDRLLPRLGLSLAKPMLDELVKSDDESVREGIAERLIALGDGVGPFVVARLKDSRWEVRFTLLSVLGKLGDLPEEFSPAHLMGDPDPRVRRLAMDLELDRGGDRATVLDMAVRDPDSEIWGFGFERAAEKCPPALVPRLIEIARTGRYGGGQRLAAIRVLGASRQEEALETLLDLTWQRRFLFMYGLRPKTSEMLEALGSLGKHWAGEPRARQILAKAKKSRDPQIRSLGSRGGGAG